MTPLPPIPVLSEAQDGATVTVRAGGGVEVRLSSNPSTGYSWRMIRGPPAIVMVRQTYVAPTPATGSLRPGAAGEQVFDLRVEGVAGRIIPLVLTYKPPGRALAFGRIWRVRLRLVEPRIASQAGPQR